MPVCAKCKEDQPDDQFRSLPTMKKSQGSTCRGCRLAERTARRRTPEGRASQAWGAILQRLRTRSTYAQRELRVTRAEFMDWAVPLYEAWDHGQGTPSIDRVDNDGHYEISNLQMIPRRENARKESHRANAPPGMLWCCGCQGYLAEASFGLNKYMSNGRSNLCFECRRIASAESYERRKDEINRKARDKYNHPGEGGTG